MLLPIKTAEIAAGLICHRPVMVLGPVGSGKFNVAVQAMEIVSPYNNGSLGYIHIDMKYARRADERDVMWSQPIAPRARFMTKVQSVLKNNPDKGIIYSTLEYATPEWIAPMLEQMMFSKRKVILVGDFRTRDELYNFMPLLDRCQIVEM